MEPMKPMKPMEPMKPMKPMQTEVWWPKSLGEHPNSAGSQNEVRYAYFGDAHRLAVDRDGTVTVHDTGKHRISGVAQAQGTGQSAKVVFTGQDGEVELASLPTVPAQG